MRAISKFGEVDETEIASHGGFEIIVDDAIVFTEDVEEEADDLESPAPG